MGIFESLLIDTFTVERMDRFPDGQGGWIISYGAIGTVEGRIRPASAAEREIAATEERHISHVLYTVADEEIARGDRLTTGDLTVEVMGVREPSHMAHHWEIDCLERQYDETDEFGS